MSENNDLLSRLDRHALYVGMEGHTNNSTTSNLLIEAAAALRASAPETFNPEADIAKMLQDPAVVHLNMLRGGIAKPSWANIKHLYPEQFAENANSIPTPSTAMTAEARPDATLLALADEIERSSGLYCLGNDDSEAHQLGIKKTAMVIAALRAERDVLWRDMSTAPKDGTQIIAVVAPGRSGHLEYQAGRAFIVRHEGMTDSDYDLGWAVYPGFGGASGHDFSCWRPLDAFAFTRAALATPTPSDAMTVDAEELAIWLHNETDHPEHCPGYTWPENEHDDGRREGGFVKIVPKYAQEYFRDIARRMIAGPLSRHERGTP